MTNKKLVVQLYAAIIQAQAIMYSNPKLEISSIKTPSPEEAIQKVAEIAELLTNVKD